MDDCRYGRVCVLEPRHDAVSGVRGQFEVLPFDVYVVTTLVVPVRDLRGSVTQRLAEPFLNLSRARALGHGRENRADSCGAGDRRAEESGEEEERDCGERCDQGDDDDRVRDPRERREDEADREEQHTEPAGEIDGAQDATQGRRTLTPASDEEHERRGEEKDRDRRPERRHCNVRGVIVGNEHGVVRAVVRLARVSSGEHGVEERREERGRITRDDEDARAPAEQLPARIREQEVQVGGDEQASEQRSERVRDRVVGLAQAADQDAETDCDHQHPRAVLRPPRPADQAGEDEGPADEEPERDRERRVLFMIARDGQSDGERTCQERRRPEVEPGPPCEGHAMRRAAIAAPDRSAFGTKPLAPQTWMQRP